MKKPLLPTALALLFFAMPSAAGNAIFAWSATCTAACGVVGLNDGDPVSGILMIDESLAFPLNDISEDDIAYFRFDFGDLTMEPPFYRVFGNVDANVSIDGDSISMLLLQIYALDPDGPKHIQQPGGVWNVLAVAGVFLFGVDGNYERLVDGDLDGDQVIDSLDNCILTPNPDQTDVDGEGYGNACDADINNDNVVNSTDLGIFRLSFFATGPNVADFNSDGVVNVFDLGILKTRFFGAPGPSGLVP